MPAVHGPQTRETWLSAAEAKCAVNNVLVWAAHKHSGISCASPAVTL